MIKYKFRVIGTYFNSSVEINFFRNTMSTSTTYRGSHLGLRVILK